MLSNKQIGWLVLVLTTLSGPLFVYALGGDPTKRGFEMGLSILASIGFIAAVYQMIGHKFE